MTQDEIRKLLGGYATNALNADERKLLFEAALEDQELFNALHDEDALRELLADPVSREQVRRALADASAKKRRASFWSRRWVFGVAIPAVAAVIVIAIMNRANAPRLIGPVPETVARSIAPPEPIAPTALVPRHPVSPQPKKKQSAPGRLVEPVVPAPIQLESARIATPQAARGFLAAAPSQMPEGVRQQFSAGFAADAPLYQGPLVRYSLIRSGADGDAIRVEVSTGIAGYLALYQVDPAGNSKRVYPASEVAARVLADRTIQIPTDPIRVDAGDRLRLVVVPAEPSGAISLSTGSVGGAVNGTALGTGNQPFPAQPTPLVVDIPLAPN
jgi:hypothetical protein